MAEFSCSERPFVTGELSLFDPPGRRGAPGQIPRRQMVDAMLFIGRTGIQWRYLPER